MLWKTALAEYYAETEVWIIQVYMGRNIVASDAIPAKYHGKPGDTGALHHVADWVHRKYDTVDVVNFPGLGMEISRNVKEPDTDHYMEIENRDRATLDAYIRFQESAPCWHESSTDRYKFFTGDSLKPSDRDGLHHFSATY